MVSFVHARAIWGKLALVAADDERERLAATFDQAAELYQGLLLHPWVDFDLCARKRRPRWELG